MLDTNETNVYSFSVFCFDRARGKIQTLRRQILCLSRRCDFSEINPVGRNPVRITFLLWDLVDLIGALQAGVLVLLKEVPMQCKQVKPSRLDGDLPKGLAMRSDRSMTIMKSGLA